MSTEIKWSVALVCPGEEELALLAELASRQDTRIVGLVDPEGLSLGAGLAEIMGIALFTDLESLPEGEVRYLIHPTVNEEIAPFVDSAPDFGMEPLTAHSFSGMMLKTVLAQQTAPRAERPRINHDFLEMETTAIHRTLSRLEEALDRESLLRWLLGLATRATRAGSGSIMLYDKPAEELYLAFAYGLSETTMHRTRVQMGDGIAGRVATTGEAEFIAENRHPGSRRDRSQVKAAICAPINWEGKLLGVLNISTTEGEDDLAPNAMDIVQSLTHRFGLILDRFLRMQTVHDNEQFRRMEEEFTRDTGQPENLASTLVYWAEDLATLAEADVVSLSILTADGDLLVADSEDITYESPPDPLKADVLSTGNPLVLRPDQEGTESEHPDETVFHLPIGKAPARAVISLTFFSASRSHHFHTLSSDVLYLVNRHLSNFLDKVASTDQLDRLTTLAAALSDLALGGSGDITADRERILAAACSLTGGSNSCVLKDEDTVLGCYLGSASEAILDEANRLLEQAMTRGWSSSILTIDGESGTPSPRRSMLVVPVVPGIPYPGLVILDKKRLHPLDGASFTEFDALFAKRLAPLLSREAVPEKSDPEPVSVDMAMEALEVQPSTAAQADLPPLPNSEIIPYILSEMDRCDRYHSRMGLVGFQVSPPSGPAPDLDKIIAGLAKKLRTSDRAGILDDGTILIIVPEDIQSLPRLQKRTTEILQQLTGQADLIVSTASRVYPGGADTPDALIHSVVNAMS